MPATYERLDKAGLQYLLGKVKTYVESSLPVDFTGAGAETAGAHGLVPAPAIGDNAKFLRGDGTWATTPYPNVFSGADGTNAGAQGLVPAPTATDDTKYLKGDGTWSTITIPSVPITSIKVNGVAQTPVEGAVDITVPTKVSDLTNDSNFQDDQDVADAIAAAISSTYKPAGSIAASGIASSLLVAANEGKVYNVSEQFTTTADFVEGAGKIHPAGTNIVVINNSSTDTPDWKFDVLAGFIDTSVFVTHAESAAITDSEIDTIWTAVFGA